MTKSGKSLCEEWLATVKAEAMDSISISCGSLPQYIFEGEVGQQGSRLTEHADKLLGRRLHIGVAQQVYTAVHLVALRIDRDSLHTWLGERGGFREDGDKRTAAQQVLTSSLKKHVFYN